MYLQKKSFLFVAHLVVFLLGVFFVDAGQIKAAPDPESCKPEDTEFSYVASWAWASTIGWMAFSCKSELAAEAAGRETWNGVNYGVTVARKPSLEDGSKEIRGWAWNSGAGWICFGNTCAGETPLYDPKFANVSWAKMDSEGLISGWAQIAILGNEGWISLRGLSQTGDVYGTRFGLDGEWQDYAWNGNDNGTGVGWIQFSPPYGTPWLKTKYGDVYSGGGIGSSEWPEPPAGLYNATYCILANGNIVNFTTETSSKRPECRTESQGAFLYPEPANDFVTTLGRVDWRGLYAGHYGRLYRGAIDRQQLGLLLNNGGPWNGQVIRVSGNAVIEQAVTLAPGGSGKRGNVTVIVEGDLTIRANIVYNRSLIQKLHELPSLGFLVKGDILIDEGVSELVGAYVALGKNKNCDRQQGKLPSRCGNFVTGGSGTHLTVSGLVMGRHLSFQRTASGTAGSEQVIADGRLLTNPPPGFTDLLKGLPSWQQVAP